MAVVRPFGEFPLNDDWAYSHSVAWLVDEHRIRLSDWIAMNLLPQTLMGAAVTKVTGFSFANLRLLTEALSLATSAVAFRFFVASGIGLRSAFVGALIVVCSPWWQALANSFMTDIYGLFFALLAALQFVKLLRIRSPRIDLLALGSLFSVIGVLERQVVAVIPMAFAAAWLLAGRGRWGTRLAIAAVPVLLTLIAEVAYRSYLAAGPGIPEAQQTLHGRLPTMAWELLTLNPEAIRWFVGNLGQFAGYIGMFTAVWAATRASATTGSWALPVLTAVIAGVCFFKGWMPPYRENNVVDAAGVGPFTMGRGFFPEDTHIDREKGLFWRFATVVASLGMAALALTLLATPARLAARGVRRRGPLIFVVVLVIAYVLPFAITDYIDRYLLFVLPFVLTWCALVFRHPFEPFSRTSTYAAVLSLTLAGGLLGAVATHDYFAWNRARWEAIRHAESEHGASPGAVDGGFEYNGYYNFEQRKKIGSAPGKAPWWVVDDRFQIAFEGRKNYRLVRAYPVDRWLPTTPARVVLLQRNQ